ncbi:hypothetical protein ACQEVC_13585 [Plantactinospora sp. CA-294935]|uniref:hypothetical protein n=1 Tax=Plantactinospora sp. CA-294935 TaxID=3240012 RepID=UPI003D94C22B
MAFAFLAVVAAGTLSPGVAGVAFSTAAFSTGVAFSTVAFSTGVGFATGGACSTGAVGLAEVAGVVVSVEPARPAESAGTPDFAGLADLAALAAFVGLADLAGLADFVTRTAFTGLVTSGDATDAGAPVGTAELPTAVVGSAGTAGSAGSAPAACSGGCSGRSTTKRAPQPGFRQ